MSIEKYNQYELVAKQEAEAKYCQSNNPSPVAGQCGVANEPTYARTSARDMLQQRHKQLLREANGIHELLQALPQKMHREAEEALWRIVTK